MIYVAVGTQKFPFNRLLQKLDQYIEEGLIDEPIFAQIGSSTYKPKHYQYKDFLTREKFTEYVEQCDLLITHSGVATIMLGLKCKKPVIVIPRLTKHGEHVDDHQVQIAETFAEKNYVLQCGEEDNLADLIVEARKHHFDHYVSQKQQVVDTVRNYLNTIEEKKG